jgi:hypothetical protein
MKKKFLFSVIYLFSWYLHAQDFSNEWSGHFSYLNIIDIVEGNGKIYAASENVVFSYDIITNDLDTITTVEGLAGDFISTIYYSEAFDLLIIGYQNGLLEIYSESDQNVTTVVDIIDKPTIPPDGKRLNHINEFNNFIYISTDYGISVYDLDRFEFGDTYFIGNNGTRIKVNQTEIFGDHIYAACENESGLRRALVASDDLIDYQEWTQIYGGNFLGIEKVDEKLYTTRFDRKIYEINGSGLTELFTYSSRPVDLKSDNGTLSVTLFDSVFVYDGEFNLLTNQNVSAEFETEFTSAVSTSSEVYIGTKNFGILKVSHNSPSVFEAIYPDGPLRNDAFAVQAEAGNLWVSYGDYSLSYNPSPARRYGLSHLSNEQWNNIPYDSLFNARNLNAISINPFNPDRYS